MIRVVSVILAAAGLGVGVWAVAMSQPQPVDVPLARQPSVNPFPTGVAALGIVEAAGRNIEVSAPEAGLVVEVLVDVGDVLPAGAPMFRLDGRALDAELVRARAVVASAESEVARWRSLPRAEDLPPLRAALDRARATLADREEQARLVRDAQGRGAATGRDATSAGFAVDAARADVARAEADLARVMAGGWEPDRIVLEATLLSARANVAALESLLDRLTVRAPRAGTVLRRNIEPGEFASSQPNEPAMILGDLSRLHVRAQVDEEDIALIGPSPKAVARTRGSVVREIPLTLVRVEPFARPKTDLSGSNAERVDTRIIDVVFEVAPGSSAVLVPGQAVDAFVEATPQGSNQGSNQASNQAPGAAP